MDLTFAFTLYRTQFRMIFGGKFRYQKEYEEALDILQLSSHWLYLYKSLEGPNADRVCVALKKWLVAYQAKEENDLERGYPEAELKRELHLLIYGPKYREDWHGYVEN